MNGDTGKALQMLEEDIDRALNDPAVSAETKLILGFQRRLIPYMTQQQEDHEWIDDARPVVTASKWVGGILGALNLGMLWAWLTHSGPFALGPK